MYTNKHAYKQAKRTCAKLLHFESVISHEVIVDLYGILG